MACGHNCLDGVDAMNTVKKKLTHKQNEFVKEYLINGNNGTQAAIKAGYKEDNAAMTASENLRKPYIMEEIEVRQSEITEKAEKKFEISVEWRLDMLKQVAEAGIAVYKDGNGVERRENLAATKGAIEVLNGMLTDDEENTSGDPLTIEFNVSAPVGEVRITKGKDNTVDA